MILAKLFTKIFKEGGIILIDSKNKKYNKTCVFALQSNNMFDLEEHVNCVNSEDELIEKSEISHVLYSGTRSFSYEKNQVSKNYERYMVIGLRDMWT